MKTTRPALLPSALSCLSVHVPAMSVPVIDEKAPPSSTWRWRIALGAEVDRTGTIPA